MAPGFNSLQTGKPFRTQEIPAYEKALLRFNSLQTGKPFRTQSSVRLWFLPSLPFCFNSLQTGKPFRTEGVTRYLFLVGLQVSIPFKRESPFGHDDREFFPVKVSTVSIPFKRESPFGPCIAVAKKSAQIFPLFQFPSNGKALSDMKC